jgi:hypothetical protein
MSLSDLASLGSFVSGLAVLVSLVFLYFQLRQVNNQVRQTERNQQAAIRQARSTRAVDITLRAATEPSLCEALGKGGMGVEDIPEVQLRQCFTYWRAALYEWEDAFFQHNDGLLTDSGFQAFTINIKNLFRSVGLRAIWRIQRESFSPEFARWVDTLITQAPASLTASLPELWRNALAAEREGALR